MQNKVVKSFGELEEAMVQYRAVVDHLLKGLEGNSPPQCMDHPALIRVEAHQVPMAIELTSEHKKVVVVLKGSWTYVNGTHSKELVENDMITVPPEVPARVETDMLGARCCYFEDDG